MIEYNYGQGKVIASTLYSDWGYGHGQVSGNEKTLINQLVEYALNPAISATQSLCFGGTPGICQVWATSPIDTVSPGTVLPITVHVKNNSDQDINSVIAVCADTPGGTWRNQYFYMHGVIPEVDVPAHSERSFVYNAAMDLSTNFYFIIMDMNKINAAGSNVIQYLYLAIHNRDSIAHFVWSYFLTYGELGAWVEEPRIAAGIKLDKYLYYQAEKGIISLNLTDKQGIDTAVQVSLYLLDPENIKIPITDLSLTLPANGSTDQVVEFNAPEALKQGIYMVRADISSGSNIISKAATSFQTPDTLLVVTPTLPTVLTQDNTISFKIANLGICDAPAARFNLKLTDPAGTVIFNIPTQFPECQLEG